MKTVLKPQSIKTQVNAILLGLVISAAATGSSSAMSELVSLSVEPEWPATATPGTIVRYRITAVSRAGQGLLEVSLSSAGLPEGAVVSFSPNPIRFTGREVTTQTAIMTVTCPELTTTDLLPFSITGTARRESYTGINAALPSSYRTAAALPVLALDDLGSSGLRLRGSGGTGQSYRIECTSDLANPEWVEAGSCVADGNGRFTFEDSRAKDAPMRFYRAVWLAPAGAEAGKS